MFWVQFSKGKTRNENEPPEQAMTHDEYWDAALGDARREPTAEDSYRATAARSYPC